MRLTANLCENLVYTVGEFLVQKEHSTTHQAPLLKGN